MVVGKGRAPDVIRRILFNAHRWLGTIVCIPACLWFLSGIGMMYATFPEVTEADALAHAAPIETAMLGSSSAESISAMFTEGLPVDRLRLLMDDGRPVYRVRHGAVDVARHSPAVLTAPVVAVALRRSWVRSLGVGPRASLDRFSISSVTRTLRLVS